MVVSAEICNGIPQYHWSNAVVFHDVDDARWCPPKRYVYWHRGPIGVICIFRILSDSEDGQRGQNTPPLWGLWG